LLTASLQLVGLTQLSRNRVAISSGDWSESEAFVELKSATVFSF
jgi:hypothetical protein